MKFKTRYTPHEPRKFSSINNEPSMTQQQFKAECDVNNIMAKYKKTNMISHLSKHDGSFGDFSSIEDYQTSLNKLMIAQESFGLLPSELRNKFHNDPAKLIEFINDETNTEECYKYGLKIKPEQKESLSESFEKALDSHAAKQAKKSKKPSE
jgi:phage internal scaffolding protein